MFDLTQDQKIQLLLVGAPVLSLIGTLMSLRTYGRLKKKRAEETGVSSVDDDVASHKEKNEP